MKRRFFLQKGAFLGFLSAPLVVEAKSEGNDYTTKSIIDIKEIGAKGDNATINTAIIQKAIDDLSLRGGGIVLIAGGVFITGTLSLKSNINLHITPGTVLKASPNIEDFPFIPANYELFDVNGDEPQRHLLYANAIKNVTLSGGGIIDGNFEAYRKPTDNPNQWFGTKYGSKFQGPMLEWVRCENITMNNIQVKDSMGWNNHFYMCTNLVLEKVKIRNNVYSGHSDGFDISGCHHVKISDCDIITGDDAIVFKTPKTARTCEKVSITNCILRSNCAAIKLGTGSWHDFKQFTISNIVAHQSSRAFQIVAFDGGNVEDISVQNIVCDTNSGTTLSRPIHFDTHRRRNNETGELEYPDYTKTSILKNITMSNIVIKTAGRILLTAEDGCKMKNIRLHGIQMDYPWIEDPESVKDLSDIMQGSNYSPDARTAFAAVVAKNIENFQLSDLTIEWPGETVPDDFLPIYENAKMVIDPRTTEKPLPKFHVFWGKNISGGLINTPLANASDASIEKNKLENVSVLE